MTLLLLYPRSRSECRLQRDRSTNRRYYFRTVLSQFGNKPILQWPCRSLLRTAARVGTRDLDWAKGGKSLQMQLVAFLARASRGAAAITIVYQLYGER
ncbi:hypothetical protein [Bradyrhizobium sp. 87]|uniref:hypothetical protein n=1 Tax=Bradyrhizobium sp. 87 TaxID=2782682 RepID=UPI001FFBA269|nr:hypothetical protein [Bradyrhizobium sp. 87]MCK1428658.1 hypothetical protein [Bradyrhizobium sp. 87]